MMTSSRPRGDVGGSFASRRGHASQLSISDPSHHVTEAIGTLYGDEDDYSNDRPLSFVQSPQPEQLHKQAGPDQLNDDPRRLHLLRTSSDQSGVHSSVNGSSNIKKALTLPARAPSQRGSAFENGPKSPISPTLSLRDVREEASQFPMTNIEHPSDIAQELSNLQALRRMSMDVGNHSDPDLLPFAGMSLSAMPSIAPSGGDDEGDPSRLLWVPAAVHPELAPTEFKNFLESRVQSIKRRSGDNFLSPDGIDRSNSGGLKRKKSMLSRQIDNSGGRAADNYVDGAERLDSKRSSEHSTTELSLDELVKDPTKAVQRLAQESQQGSSMGPESSADDMPILPMAPGMGLRRSTRTTYRKGGSLRSGERLSFSKRTSGGRASLPDSEAAEQAAQAHQSAETTGPSTAPEGRGISRVQSEPIAENFSRPGRSVRRQQKFSQQDAYSSLTGGESVVEEVDESATASEPGPSHTFQDQLPVRTTSTGSVPHIIETPAAKDDSPQQPNDPNRPYPLRSSSSHATSQEPSSQISQPDEPPARSSKRPTMSRTPHTASAALPASQQMHQSQQQQQRMHSANSNSLNDMASHPSPLPGGGATRTDSLTFIPTLPAEERRSDKKSRKDKEKDDDSSSIASSKSTGWSKWLKGSSEDKDKKRKEDEKKRSKSFVEKAHDNVRLDVLQNSIESAVTKGRESLLLDRDNVDSKLAEERKKESTRKSDPPKKEKEGGLFSGLFGGSKRKGEKETSSKKGHHLRVSEDPPYRPPRPDVDYHWTRFPLLEERAIYRMAHIKLANPRRSLASQVLLSNFMYNYLAIVQAMHPQVQVPQSPQQRRLEEERRRKEQEQQYLAQQQAQQLQEEADQDASGQYNFDYHRGTANQYGENNTHEGVDYIDDAQIYEYDHGGGNEQMHGEAYNGQNDYGGQSGKEYYHQQYSQDHVGDHGRRRDGQDDMW